MGTGSNYLHNRAQTDARGVIRACPLFSASSGRHRQKALQCNLTECNRFGHWNFGHWNFFRILCFGLRISPERYSHAKTRFSLSDRP
jgi:hypothetical protein